VSSVVGDSGVGVASAEASVGAATLGMVLDVETRTDDALLRASGRAGAPRGIPRGLQGISAGAILSFEIDSAGVCGNYALSSADAETGGERRVVRFLQNELTRLHRQGGSLITFNGGHDLSAIRVAALRLREFGNAGATEWLRRPAERHFDLMHALADEPSLRPRLSDLAVALGLLCSSEAVVGKLRVSRERAKCEVDVVLTMGLHLHLLAEGRTDQGTFRGSAAGLLEVAERLAVDRPHLGPFSRGRLAQALRSA
jgi:hypothetical protein